MKKIIYIHDLHFYTIDGLFFTSSNMPEVYFDRFFDAEECEIEIFSRLIRLYSIDDLPQGYIKINNNRLRVSNISPKSYLNVANLKFLIRFYKHMKNFDLVVANIPSILGMFSLLMNISTKNNFSVEVAADYDQFASKRGGWLVSCLMKPLMHYFIARSKGASYVSQYLREKYSSKNESIVSSNVNIESVVKDKYVYRNDKLEISFVGGLNERKGLINLFEAVNILQGTINKKIALNVIGGHEDRNWISVVEKLDLIECVTFYGILEKKEVINILSKSDLYVQPSLTEGIPRATLEAMSRGLPVIATKLPGFVEILDQDVLVNVNSSKELADKIKELCNDEEKLTYYSERNKIKAEMFSYEKLHEIRKEFYKKILNSI